MQSTRNLVFAALLATVTTACGTANAPSQPTPAAPAAPLADNASGVDVNCRTAAADFQCVMFAWAGQWYGFAANNLGNGQSVVVPFTNGAGWNSYQQTGPAQNYSGGPLSVVNQKARASGYTNLAIFRYNCT